MFDHGGIHLKTLPLGLWIEPSWQYNPNPRVLDEWLMSIRFLLLVLYHSVFKGLLLSDVIEDHKD